MFGQAVGANNSTVSSVLPNGSPLESTDNISSTTAPTASNITNEVNNSNVKNISQNSAVIDAQIHPQTAVIDNWESLLDSRDSTSSSNIQASIPQSSSGTYYNTSATNTAPFIESPNYVPISSLSSSNVGRDHSFSRIINRNFVPGSGMLYKDLVKKTTVPELFFFDYGVVVMWGFTEDEELQIMKDIRPFEEDSIGKKLIWRLYLIIIAHVDFSEMETEKFHYLYSRQQQARIYNDIVTLISPTQSSMIKLTISHAFAQSVKLTLFEGLIEETIESTRHIPSVMADTGKIHMHRKAINQKIGQVSLSLLY